MDRLYIILWIIKKILLCMCGLTMYLLLLGLLSMMIKNNDLLEWSRFIGHWFRFMGT